MDHASWFEKADFLGVQRYFYATVGGLTPGQIDWYLLILEWGGLGIVRRLRELKWVACFDREAMKECQEKGSSLECMCITE